MEKNRIALEKIQKAIIKGNYQEAYKIFLQIESKYKNQFIIPISLLKIKAEILCGKGDFQESIELANQVYGANMAKNMILDAIDGMEIVIKANFRIGEHQHGLKLIEKCMKIAENVKQTDLEEKREIKIRIANLHFQKSRYLWQGGNNEESLKYAQTALKEFQELGNNYKISRCYLAIGVVLAEQGKLLKSLENLQRAEILQKKNGNLEGLAMNCNNMGWIYTQLGDLNRAILFLQRGKEIYDQLHNKLSSRFMLGNIGAILKQQAKFKEAIKYLTESLEMGDELGNPYEVSLFLFDIYTISIEQNQMKKSNYYLERLRALTQKEKQIKILYRYQVAQALMFKANSSTEMRYKAIFLLRKLSQKKDMEHELLIEVLINLSDLLLTELRISNDLSILDEIEELIKRLLDIGEREQSYLLLTQTYFLLAKFRFMTLKFDEARNTLTKAQEIAEKYGLTNLAIIISQEHDKMLDQQIKLKDIKAKPENIEERIELAQIDTQMQYMFHQGMVEQIEPDAETPIYLSIIHQDGPNLYNKEFNPEFHFDSQLLGGLISAFTSFTDLLFKESFDRAKIGHFTVLLKQAASVLFCYVYKGESYLAQKKLSKFIKEIQYNTQTWRNISENLTDGYRIDENDLEKINKISVQVF
ncbi:MAG: hypothetical protein ACTSWL_10485 [Promethearchaeota archaeon]